MNKLKLAKAILSYCCYY